MKPAKKLFRKKLLIFPKFQVPVLSVNLGVILVMSVIIWVGVQNAFSDLKPAAGLSDNEREFYIRYLDYQVRYFHRALLLALVVGATFSTLFTLIITHRFSGPLLRLRGYFRDLARDEKEIPYLEFRDGDYLSDLPPLINEGIRRVQERESRDKKAS